MDLNKTKMDEEPSISQLINSLIELRDLSKGLSIGPMSLNLLIFKDKRDEDPLVHIECFIEILTTCFIMDGQYYLV